MRIPDQFHEQTQGKNRHIWYNGDSVPPALVEDPLQMGYAPKKTRSPWEDRFRTPTLEDLWQQYNRQTANLLDAALERLRGYGDLSEDLTWQGLPWRWTITFRSQVDNGRAWAYLVPDPEKPKLAMPLTSAMVSSMPLHRMKKHVRDGVLQSRLVDGVYWATWDLTGKDQLKDILELADRKRKMSIIAQN